LKRCFKGLLGKDAYYFRPARRKGEHRSRKSSVTALSLSIPLYGRSFSSRRFAKFRGQKGLKCGRDNLCWLDGTSFVGTKYLFSNLNSSGEKEKAGEAAGRAKLLISPEQKKKHGPF